MNVDVAVVGAGAAGVDAAAAVRSKAPEASVALISPHDELVYRPWLIYLPASAVATSDLTVPLSPVAERHGFQLLRDAVTHIDPVAGELTLASAAEKVHYRQLVLCPGAPADCDRIPGGCDTAVFACDTDEAHHLMDLLNDAPEASVTFVLTGERIGPGLEYAGWTARAAEQAGTPRQIRLVEDGDALDAQFGPKAADKITRIASSLGIETVRHARIDQIDKDRITLADGVLPSDITSITSPLRGPDLGLRADLLNPHKMLKVDATLTVPEFRNVHAVGDYSDVQGLDAVPGGLPKTWMMARLQAQTAAQNVAAALHGKPLTGLNQRKAARMAALSMPDIGGQTLLVRGRKPLFSGAWPLRLRYRIDAKYLTRYRTARAALRPQPPVRR